MVCWNRDGGAAYRAVVSTHRRHLASWEELEGIQPNLTPDEWHECDEALRARAAPDRGAGQARHHGHGPVLFDVWGYRGFLVPERTRGGGSAGRTPGIAARPAPTRTRTRSTACTASSTSTRWSCCEIEDTFAVDRPPIMGEYVPRLVPDLQAARRPQADRDHPARGRLVHARRPRADVAELDAAARLQPPRGARPAHARLRRARDRAPPLAGRDGRPLPRSVARPLPPHGLRHRRVGPRLHDPVARARLRLPGRDPLPRRGAARHRAASRTRSPTPSASTRRTTASSGSTSTTSRAPRSAARAGS